MKRPLGIAILAGLAVIGGIFGLVDGVIIMTSPAAKLLIPGMTSMAGALGLALAIVGILELALSYGLWRMRPWAWLLGIGLEIVGFIVFVLASRAETISNTLVELLVAGFIIYYLWLPQVRKAFVQD